MTTARSPAMVIAGVAPELAGMSRLADTLEAEAFLPGRRALAHAARAAAERAAAEDGRPVAVVLPSTRPWLVALAARDPCLARIALYHRAGAVTGRALGVALRAAFAAVDLCLVVTAEDEADAVRAGADPDRLARVDDPELARRWVREPPRARGRSAALEAGASLALDALELGGALAAAERLTPFRGVNVVNYHRVLEPEAHRSYTRPQMALAAPIFEAQLEAFGRRRGFVPAEHAHAASARDRVAVTFDDGYEDNFRVALPALERWAVPATIYVVTGLIGAPEAPWWDRVGRGLLVWWREGAADPSPSVRAPEVDAPEPLAGALARLAAAGSEAAVRAEITDLLSALNGVDPPIREAILERVERLGGDGAPRTMLSWDEIRRMQAAGIRFGSHTRSHVVLDQLDPAAAEDEVVGSQRSLEAELGPDGASPSTALPRGVLGPFTEARLREVGFRAVMTTEAHVNRADADAVFVHRRDGKMLTLKGRHHPAKLRLELTGLLDPLRGKTGD